MHETTQSAQYTMSFYEHRMALPIKLLPRCIECRRGLASSDKKAVCPSLCLSVKRVDCDKTGERSVQIFIPYERSAETRPRRSPPETKTRPRCWLYQPRRARDKTVKFRDETDNFSREETETTRWYVSRSRRRDRDHNPAILYSGAWSQPSTTGPTLLPCHNATTLSLQHKRISELRPVSKGVIVIVKFLRLRSAGWSTFLLLLFIILGLCSDDSYYW